jgi:L-lactate dehydrogenase complex protein LldF
VRIDIPRMLIELRQAGVSTRTAPWSERAVFGAFARLLRAPAVYRFSARVARLLQRPFVRHGAIHSLPLFLGEWTRTRDLPAVASRTFSERWESLEREASRPGAPGR